MTYITIPEGWGAQVEIQPGERGWSARMTLTYHDRLVGLFVVTGDDMLTLSDRLWSRAVELVQRRSAGRKGPESGG